MALTSNSTNKFGPSSYIVGTQLGNGCNFILVQDAINQAVADGFNTVNPATVLVRAGNYAGTFTMAPGIYVVGVGSGADSISNTIISASVIIDATTAGGITYGLENLFITDGGTTFTTINAGNLVVDVGNCTIAGDTAVTITNVSGTFSQFVFRDCRLSGLTNGLSLEEHNILRMDNCDVTGGTTAVAVSGTARLFGKECSFNGTTTYGFEMTGGTCQVNLRNSTITSTQEAFIGPNIAESVFMAHCTVDCSAVSGLYLDSIFSYEFYDVALIGSAVLSNEILNTFVDWQPHSGTAGTSTLPGGVRGTSCFKNTDFSVINGFVELSASALGTYPVDNGGPGVPLLGAMSLLGSTSVDFPNPSGIESHVGATTNEIYLEDRRWISPLIVDPDATVGLRGTFTTITAALAAADSLQTVYVRPGTYTESFTTVDLVNIVGLTAPSGGLHGLGSSTVLIDGTITAGVGSSTVQNLSINTAGTGILVDNGGAIINVVGCTVNSTTISIDMQAGIAFLDASNISGSVNAVSFNTNPGAVVEALNCRMDSAADAIRFDVVGQFTADGCDILGSGAAGIFDNAGGTIVLRRCEIEGVGNAALDMQVAGTADISNCRLTSPIQTINFNAAPPVVTSYHNTHICTGASSEYVVGPGSYTYADDVVSPITFGGIDGAATQTILGWRPWATTAGSPGTNSDKGNASFDSAQFTSTDGFIQLSGGNSPVFTDVSGVLLAARNNGYYATAATTFTLDSLALQGDLVIIYADTAAAVVVTANAGQQIRLGSTISAVAGTCTSTAIGDSLTLRFRSATSGWLVINSVGNWTVV